MTSYFATEWGKDGIRVNAVSPWYIKTPLVEAVLSDRDKEKKILNHTPLQRVGEPVEVAKAILFLASDDASYITGVNLPVDGGFSYLGMIS
jgi:Tropinone reductase 1